ncbi:TonB-dependent receptor [Pseudoxanthomonas mexicana]|uniref:TonB-dependent receptor n=1 Tax=Pseudoxanthomonas mexicana TaxID=128785 RepID=A0ABX6R7J8_PSEMX|nr:TonB-dependent receptor [Pseudoxanthomonas mexicana]QND79207.1 TonB-dependent receptor [Pseudoxanthomonas mexicana]
MPPRSPFRLRPLAIAVSLLLLASVPPAFAQENHSDDHDHHDEDAVELDAVIVESTRSGRRVSEEPIRVDVINREEIEEKLLMSPGNISMLVAETAGVRVQSTSPALGASNIRIQGLRGRYTQLLADGLPLYGGQSSSIGLLQIPPTDLGRVEIIKGSASALYGPAALGGVINLITRRPRDERDAELLLNVTSRGGYDATAYTAALISDTWSYSLVGGYHEQDRQDLDDDGWIDMPEYERWTVRPRLFWNSENGAKALITFGATKEDRIGGTTPGALMPDGEPFPLTQDTERYDAGAVIEIPVRETDRLQVRASAMSTDHLHRFGEVLEDDRHQTGFAEVSYASGFGDTTWLAGTAVQTDRFESQAFPAFNHRYTVPGVFVQAEQSFREDLILSGSARWDDHSEYGDHVSPRLSLLYRPGKWTLRTSVGKGFYGPTPFVEEIEAAGLSRLAPLEGLKAETAKTASLDVGYASGPWETNVALFASDIDHAARLAPAAAAPDGTERVQLVNIAGVTRTRGAELLLRYRWQDFVVTGSYVFTDAKEPQGDGAGRQRVPLTPRHTAGLVAMWEQHGRGRVGIEAYYTGTQPLDENPYRRTGRPYVELGALGEITLGKVSLFLNLENLLNIRQTDYHPMTLPQRGAEGQWTVDAWAPTDGFVVNGGVRIKF